MIVGSAEVELKPTADDFSRDARRAISRDRGVFRDAGASAGAAYGAGVESETSRWGSRFRGAAAAIGRGAGLALVGGLAVIGASVPFFASTVEAASDLNETISRTRQVFGKSATAVEKFASTSATALGQSREEALTAAGNYGNLFINLGLSEKAAARMSTQLVRTASDLASFNNTDPSEMLANISSALAGEYDPLQRYGFAISAAAVEQEGLRLKLAATTEKLTQADKAQAAYSLILKQTGKATGDFSRTSSGMANQQRIMAAQWHELKTTVGQALLPSFLQASTAINTQLLPALQKLAREHGPEISAWLGEKVPAAIDKLTQLVNRAGPEIQSLLEGGISPQTEQDIRNVTAAASALAPALANAAKSGGGTLSSSLTVLGTATAFLAEHADTLSTLMPFLVAGFAAYKAAQAAANAATFLAIPLKIAEISANRQLAASNLQLVATRYTVATATGAETAAQTANTAASNAGFLASTRARVAAVASAAAQRAVTVATGVWTAAQWLLNAALTANPIGIVVVAIAALVAGIVLAYKRSETFRNIVQAAGRMAAAAFGWVWDRIKALLGWIRANWPLLLAILTGPIGIAVRLIIKHWDTITSSVRAIPGKIKAGFGKAKDILLGVGKDIIGGLISGMEFMIQPLINAGRALVDKIPGPMKKVLGISSPSKVTQRFGRWVGEGLAKGMLGTLPDVREAARRLASNLSGDLERDALQEARALEDLARQRERLAARLDSAKKKLADAIKARDDYARSIRESVTALGDITKTTAAEGQKLTPEAIVKDLEDKLAATRVFRRRIAQLQKLGLNRTSLQQILAAGVDGGGESARALLEGGRGAIAQVNRLTGALGQQAAALGKAAAERMYGAGVRAAQGLVRGLEARRKELERVARTLAAALVAELKRRLKIKSPSAVMADEVGRQIPDGVAQGIRKGRPAVDGALRGLVRPSLAELAGLTATSGRADLAAAGATTGGRTNVYQIDARGMTPRELARELEDRDRLDDALYRSVR